MKTYPYTTPDGIIELVRKDEHDADIHELNERLTKQQSDMLGTIVNLRAKLARVSRLVDVADKANEDQTDIQVALSSSFAEAVAYTEIDRLEEELTRWQSLAESLANAIKEGGLPTGENCKLNATFHLRVMRDALAAYESAKKGEPCKTCGGSKMTAGWYPTYNDPDNAGMHPEAEPCPDCQSAKSGNLPDPLAEAVKRMEAVPEMELERVWSNAHRTRLLPCIEAVRARLISAAKGEQP